MVVVTTGLSLGATQEQARDMRIRLKWMEFDPLMTAPVTTPTGWDRWIVQFNHSLTRAERARVQREYGLRVDHYIPDGAYLERIDTGRVTDLRRDPLVRWVGPYLPEYKLDPAVLRRRDADPSREMMVLVAGYADVSSEKLLEAIRRIGARAEAMGAPPAGTPRARVAISGPADLTALSRLPEVLLIEPWPRIVVDQKK
jgi:hypothetical protein